MKTDIPFWLQHTWITGREEGDEGSGADEGDNSEDNGEEGEDEGQETGSEDSAAGDDELASLKKALAEERKARRTAERNARKASKSQNNEEEQKTLEETRQTLAEEQAKTTRIADRLRTNEVDQAIRDEARKQGFIDETDALTDEVRKGVEVDQDPDDPADIDVDLDTVKAAVSKLANQKKHLLGKPNEGEPSGGKFSRKKSGQNDGKTQDAVLKETYPSLR